MKTTGYSGTPLAKKLGIKESSKIKLVNEPEYYFSLFNDFPSAVTVVKDKKVKKDLIHFFTKQAAELSKEILNLKNEIVPNGIIWISWPKKTSGVETDVNENVVRELALQNGLVDIKVCAVDEMWSALKLVIPLKDR